MLAMTKQDTMYIIITNAVKGRDGRYMILVLADHYYYYDKGYNSSHAAYPMRLMHPGNERLVTIPIIFNTLDEAEESLNLRSGFYINLDLQICSVVEYLRDAAMSKLKGGHYFQAVDALIERHPECMY